MDARASPRSALTALLMEGAGQGDKAGGDASSPRRDDRLPEPVSSASLLTDTSLRDEAGGGAALPAKPKDVPNKIADKIVTKNNKVNIVETVCRHRLEVSMCSCNEAKIGARVQFTYPTI